MRINTKNRRRERGNIFLIIIMGIALFAGLSFMISRGMRSETTERMSDRELKLAVSDVLDFGARVERAVNKLRQNGCSENEITFEDNDGYSMDGTGAPFVLTNANSPGDFSCHVFHPEGGNVSARLPVPEKAAFNITAGTGHIGPRSFRPIPVTVLGNGLDAGTAGVDLVLQIGRLTENMCNAINDELGHTFTTNPPIETLSFNSYTGTFPSTTNVLGDLDAELVGLDAFCIDWIGGNPNGRSFYQVLIAR